LLRRDPNGDSTNVKAQSPLLANREVKRLDEAADKPDRCAATRRGQSSRRRHARVVH